MSKASTPQVSILMPVYNAKNYLKESIESILNQTFSNFEFIIIDDASNDGSLVIIDFYKQRDSRIKVFSNPCNLGIIDNLNKGIQNISTDYIARMDADDIAFPDRIEQQIKFLEENPNISVLGTNMIQIDHNSKIIKPIILSSESLLIKWNLFFWNPIAHPTVMIRSSLIEDIGGYNKNFLHIEDYELWLRASEKYDFYNLNKVLLYYRVHSTNISVSFENEQIESFKSLSKNYISKLIDEEVDSSVVNMIQFRASYYNSQLSYHLLQKIYEHFITKNNLTIKQDQHLIIKDMYNKLLGIVKRDKSCLRKIKILIQIVKNDLGILPLLLSSKVRSKIKFIDL